MSRFRYTYEVFDFGLQHAVCIDDRTHRQGVRFLHRPRHGKRRSYMLKVIEAKTALRSWLRNDRNLRARARLERRLRTRVLRT